MTPSGAHDKPPPLSTPGSGAPVRDPLGSDFWLNRTRPFADPSHRRSIAWCVL